jgi:2-keto-4-pentenoate hydratase/2-oxohepta-3-ene-1,7-dioic acid hydratase in catechol pathway
LTKLSLSRIIEILTFQTIGGYMRIIRFSLDNKTRYGILKDKLISSLKKDPFSTFSRGNQYECDGNTYSLEEVKLLPPCLPSKLVCLGLNYLPHAQEFNVEIPNSPLIFLKPSTAVIGPDDEIVLPKGWKRVDYECELGIVIGKIAKSVSLEKARDYVIGYTCVNDVTERQFQKDDGQWTRAKGFDTFAPIGPWIETEVKPDDLKVETFLNNELRQSGRTSELIFGINKLISFISSVMTLLPGDIISTGTPAGIAPMKKGDIVEIKIEKIGTLRNPVIESK